MNFSLIICTYQRSSSLLRLLESLKNQTLGPNEILIVDGSMDSNTEEALWIKHTVDVKYFRVEPQERGLTRQRNFGVEKAATESEVLFFLDDDTIPHPEYFEQIIQTYDNYPEAVGVAGYITNETNWQRDKGEAEPLKDKFFYDGWYRVEGSRFSLRRKFGLAPTAPPGFMPDFSHGYSIGFLPPSGKIYEVELLMGGVASYKRALFNRINFSSYFEGYGLYEDADFSLRASKFGKLYLNSNAKVEHHHATEGRPNSLTYGKMVIRNGWYVWKVKYPKPPMKMKVKWVATATLLAIVRIINGTKDRHAIKEGLGRFIGIGSLIFNRPSPK